VPILGDGCCRVALLRGLRCFGMQKVQLPTYPREEDRSLWPRIQIEDHSQAKPWCRARWHINHQHRDVEAVQYQDRAILGPTEGALGPAVKWTFSRHRIVLALDVKASLCVIGPEGGLLLDSVLTLAQRTLAALSQAAATADAAQGGVLVSVVAQGSRISDMRILIHSEVLDAESLPSLCRQLADVWSMLCVEITQGDWCDSAAAAGRHASGFASTDGNQSRRANLQVSVCRSPQTSRFFPISSLSLSHTHTLPLIACELFGRFVASS